jgi:hypothetical protein
MNRPNHFREVEPTIQRGDIAAMYRSRDADPLAQSLRDMYHPPAIFEHGRETLVAQIEAQGAPGCISVRVFEARTPVASYVIATERWCIYTMNPKLARELALEAAAGEITVEWLDAIATPQAIGAGEG